MPDHQSDAFVSPYKSFPLDRNETVLDKLTDSALGGYSRWDAQYFLHISVLGYSHENCIAFFPLFPLLIRFVSRAVEIFLIHNISEWNAALLSSCLVNLLLFVAASRYIYLITLKVAHSVQFATRTWLFFCISPATVFFLAPYSEILFSSLAFAGIYYGMNGRMLASVFFFGLSTATRSNGLLNLGYLWFRFLVVASGTKAREIPSLLVTYVVYSLVCISPFAVYQIYTYQQFCQLHTSTLPGIYSELLSSRGLVIPGTSIPEWCHSKLPMSYSAVQSAYWHVGFLRYYEWKQVPNFLLAAPVLSLIAVYVYCFAKFVQTRYLKKCEKSNFGPIFGLSFTPFVVHSAFLSIFSLLFAHVQVRQFSDDYLPFVDAN